MEYLSLLLADRMIKCQVIEEDDKEVLCIFYSVVIGKNHRHSSD